LFLFSQSPPRGFTQRARSQQPTAKSQKLKANCQYLFPTDDFFFLIFEEETLFHESH
jgi:hypothetical protein